MFTAWKTRRKVWAISVVLLALFAAWYFGQRLRDWNLPEKDRQFARARAKYQRVAAAYRWTGRLFDLHDRALGASKLSRELAGKIEVARADAWDAYLEASHVASYEIMGVFTNSHLADEAYARLHLNNLGRKFTMKITKLGPEGYPKEWELRVPNSYAAQAATAIENTEVFFLAALHESAASDLSKLMATLETAGIRTVSFSRGRFDGGPPMRTLVVLEKDRGAATQILNELSFRENL